LQLQFESLSGAPLGEDEDALAPDEAQARLLEQCLLTDARASLRREDVADRIGPNAKSALTTWYQSACSVNRATYRGWAVLDARDKRLNSTPLEWREACRLADREGGRIAIWTHAPKEDEAAESH
jgi:hypothetical protein